MNIKNKGLSFLIVLVAYICAFGAASIVFSQFNDSASWVQIATADLAATLVIFIFSLLFRNSSIYDPFWSVMPAVLAVFLWLNIGWYQGETALNGTKNTLLLALVLLYGFRLTYNWARGWPGLHHEDWRYVDLQKQTGAGYWLVSLTGIHLFPSLLTFLGSLPLCWAMYQEGPMGILQYAGAAILLTGIVVEAAADQQLRNFRLSNNNPTQILDKGLWAWSRHPNYFGEMLVWWGIAVSGWAMADQSFLHPFWNWAGAIGITLLFVFISVPMIDKRMLARRPGYAERMKKVPALLPWKIPG